MVEPRLPGLRRHGNKISRNPTIFSKSEKSQNAFRQKKKVESKFFFGFEKFEFFQSCILWKFLDEFSENQR